MHIHFACRPVMNENNIVFVWYATLKNERAQTPKNSSHVGFLWTARIEIMRFKYDSSKMRRCSIKSGSRWSNRYLLYLGGSAGSSSSRLCAHSGSRARVGRSVGGHARRSASATLEEANVDEDATFVFALGALDGAVMADVEVTHELDVIAAGVCCC